MSVIRHETATSDEHVQRPGRRTAGVGGGGVRVQNAARTG